MMDWEKYGDYVFFAAMAFAVLIAPYLYLAFYMINFFIEEEIRAMASLFQAIVAVVLIVILSDLITTSQKEKMV